MDVTKGRQIWAGATTRKNVPSKKKTKAKKKAPTMSKWVPILRVPGYDFDEATGEFGESSQIIELQQEVHSKRIRAIVVPD